MTDHAALKVSRCAFLRHAKREVISERISSCSSAGNIAESKVAESKNRAQAHCRPIPCRRCFAPRCRVVRSSGNAGVGSSSTHMTRRFELASKAVLIVGELCAGAVHRVRVPPTSELLATGLVQRQPLQMCKTTPCAPSPFLVPEPRRRRLTCRSPRSHPQEDSCRAPSRAPRQVPPTAKQLQRLSRRCISRAVHRGARPQLHRTHREHTHSQAPVPRDRPSPCERTLRANRRTVSAATSRASMASRSRKCSDGISISSGQSSRSATWAKKRNWP